MQHTTLAIFATIALALPAAAADISGSWNLTGDVVGNPVEMKCAFTQASDKVTGSCAGALGSTPTTGSVAGDKVTFQNTVQQYELTFTGALDATGAKMQGEIAVAGVTGTFSATKEAKDAAAPKAASGPDVAGTWSINGDVVGNVIDMKCVLTRDGVKVSGNCKYKDLGDSPTTGTVAENKVTLQNHVVREQPYDLTYTGTLDASGTSIKGDIAVAGVTGTFSGTKDK